MPYCTSCGKETSSSDRFCSHCGKPVINSNVNAHAVHVHTHQQTTPEQAHHSVCTPEIVCPCCGEKSDSIKRYTMFRVCLFLICYINWQTVTYTCCPDCMRKKILDEGVFTSKIITANFFWLIFILPLAIIQLFLCNQKGHSKGIM